MVTGDAQGKVAGLWRNEMGTLTLLNRCCQWLLGLRAPLLPLLAPLLLVPLLLAPKALAAGPEIKISGGIKSLRENIRNYLSIGDESCQTPPWRLNALLAHSETEIRTAAQALGYYDLRYDTELGHKDDCWTLDIQLTPGEPVRVTELRIEILGEGDADPAFKPLWDNPGIKLGNRFNHDHYENLKTRITNIAAAQGYFDGEFALARVEVSRAEKSARIALVYNSGLRYRFGDISLHHNILNEDFLRRYLNIAEGDYYDSDKLLELRSQYGASNYFTVATASPNLQKLDNGTVPIDILLEERKRHEYSIGAGAATDTGPRLLLGFEDRYINQRGHRLNADLNAAEKKSTAQVAYTIPMKKPAQEFLRIYTGYVEENLTTKESKKHIYGTSYSFLLNNRWLQTYALDFEQEESRIGSQPSLSTNLLIPSVSLTRTQTDGRPYPRSGWSLLGKFSGSPQSLGSDYSFLQFYSRAKLIYSVGNGRILLRSELGTTSTVDFEDLPASVRFFAGGDQSVRGYSYESLGPKTLVDNGDGTSSLEVTGGKHLLTTGIEYDRRIRESNWVVAAFFDAGNAADNFDNVDYYRGAGLGVRWISPIGPVRFDVAKALDGNEGWRIHISMGPDL